MGVMITGILDRSKSNIRGFTSKIIRNDVLKFNPIIRGKRIEEVCLWNGQFLELAREELWSYASMIYSIYVWKEI